MACAVAVVPVTLAAAYILATRHGTCSTPALIDLTTVEATPAAELATFSSAP